MGRDRSMRWRRAGRRLMKTALATGLALGMGMTVGGCSLNKLTADQTAGLMATGSLALDRESDLQFARESMPASLKTLEIFLLNSPRNEDMLLLLAKGFNSYAFGFLEGDLEKARLEGTSAQVEELNRRTVLHYLRGRTYGFMLLDYVDLEQAALGGDLKAVGRHLNELQSGDAGALFWTAYGWLSAINLSQDDPDMVGSLPIVEAMMKRALELDADYMGGMPNVVMGVYYASRPPMFGGDPDKAREHFEAALRRHGKSNLLVPFMYGRFYAAQTQDRALFNKMMARVLEAEPAEHPDMRLNNEIARERARFWTRHVDEIFFE